MDITTEEVLRVADLARLRFTPEEAAKLSGDLGAILTYVEKLGELNLDGVEPMAHVHAVANVSRPDGNRPSLPNEKALANAPAEEAGCFRVAKVIEEA